ncbi:uncharacterized protein F4822DRAFT_295310 [Hypoxylon trugodes]|uniref:uncharacterized protein n=1 Tax=Hypoxylon trugodes TaxID=326681 RepID=UPI002194DF07|nr:uncharacterized protein F4822DRAFT_295310 [Hypoxylon trugodes]KAI1387894.1 hypothetical protein F4822DRAFT_295310 [Hypoxylon trugodes]
MTERRGSHLSYSFSVPMPPVPPRSDGHIEPIERAATSATVHKNHRDQVNRRRHNSQRIIENPLTHLTEEELQRDVFVFAEDCLPEVDRNKLLRAARVAQNDRFYYEIARSEEPEDHHPALVTLTPEEKTALRAEKDVLFSGRKMIIVILTVSLAAFLQGFVQSSINGASLYASEYGLPDVTSSGFDSDADNANPHPDDWKLGATNASPFIFAGLIGCWLALPINDLVGRRGAMAVAACLVFVSSLGAVWCTSWYSLLGVRVVNGVGMGVKAVSTPILASETAVGSWRGSSILAWQLWVSFGIMMGFAFNLIFYTAHNDPLIVKLILGAPLVPSIFLMIGLWFCPESPRYYMRRRTSSYDPAKAYDVLLRLRQTELQALRDIYLIYKSVQLEEYSGNVDEEDQDDDVPRGCFAYIKKYAAQYKQLFTQRRLRNALISSSIVALAQQLCGINLLAFYSGSLFSGIIGDSNRSDHLKPMLYSLGYGAVNFFFSLPAIRTIDTLGRRKWLVLTLPAMCLAMLAASLSSMISDAHTKVGVVTFFVFLFAAIYSPGMGPIPFTLASESFPLSHREAGCAFAIAINLLFAGLIQMFFPSIYAGLKNAGSLGLFAALNFLAFVLVFLFVEETKRRSLEDLSLIFAVRKRDFVMHQITQYIPWFIRYYLLGHHEKEKPSLYVDMIWGGPRSMTWLEGGDGVNGEGVDDGWNGFGGGEIDGNGRGRTFSDDHGVPPSVIRRPSAFMMSDLGGSRDSEDSNDSAHR